MANVSKAVVSKVLNDRPDVAASTRQAVLKVIEELQYVPNRRAQELSLGISKDIAVVLPSDNSVYMRFLFATYRNLSEKGFNVSFHITDHESQKEDAILDILRAQSLRGVIYFADPDGSIETEEALLKLNVPAIVIGENGKRFDSFDHVYCDEREMAYSLVRMMALHEADNLLCICLPGDKNYQKKRNAYMKEAIASLGASLKTTFITTREVSGYGCFNALTQLEPEIIRNSSALCLYSNVYIDGMLRFFNEKEHLINLFNGQQQLFIFGDASNYNEMNLRQSYVSLPIDALAQAATSTLIRRFAHPDEPYAKTIILPFEKHESSRLLKWGGY